MCNCHGFWMSARCSLRRPPRISSWSVNKRPSPSLRADSSCFAMLRAPLRSSSKEGGGGGRDSPEIDAPAVEQLGQPCHVHRLRCWTLRMRTHLARPSSLCKSTVTAMPRTLMGLRRSWQQVPSCRTMRPRIWRKWWRRSGTSMSTPRSGVSKADPSASAPMCTFAQGYVRSRACTPR